MSAFETELAKGVPWADPGAEEAMRDELARGNWNGVWEVLEDDGHLNAACGNYAKAEIEWNLAALAAGEARTRDELRAIHAGSALAAVTENDLEERGLIVQTDKPYATLTPAGLELIGGGS